MAQAAVQFLLEQGLPPTRLAGWLNVPAETAQPLTGVTLHPARPTGVNYPTAEAVAGTERILQLMDQVGPGELVLCLISGGGSALLCAPAPGLTLEDKQAVTRLLHRSGADIGEMNAVRKHLSRIKGGGLTSRLAARGPLGQRLLCLVISDVIGDPLDVIASGPTCPDPTTFADAINVLRRRGLWDETPAAARGHLEAGLAGRVAETLKVMPRSAAGGDLAEHRLIATNAHAVAAAAAAARQRGWHVQTDTEPYAGDVHAQVRAVARQLRDVLQGPARDAPVALIAGGEPTVVLPSTPGQGGRNQHFILGLLAELTPTELERVTVLCAGTDGEDGPTDAAGGFADAAAAATLAPATVADHLRRCDAYPILAAADALWRPGLTHTNVMDLRVAVVWPA
jgi:glycerate-2-kinase